MSDETSSTTLTPTNSVTSSVVTGGGGFVGRHLVDALLERGDNVTVLEMSGPAPREHERLTWLNGDIRDTEIVAKICAGADVVFHNASLVHTKKNQIKTVWAVNLDGTRNVLEACQAAGVKRLVYVGSASAVYEGKDIEGGDETMPYSSVSQAPYADSKIAAERLVLAASGKGGVKTTALRPHVVFGPGDTRFLPAIIKRAEAGRLKFSVGWGSWMSDFTYIDNLIDALIAADVALATDAAPNAGEAYFITNGEPMEFWGFVKTVLKALDLPPIRAAVPYPIAWTAAAIAEGIDTLRGGTLNAEDGMTRFAVRYMCTHHYFRIDKARRDLGWAPSIDLQEGIKRTCAAIQAQS